PKWKIHGTPAIIQFDQTLDIRFAENSAPYASLGKKKVPNEGTELAAEPPAERNGKSPLGPMQNFFRQDAFHSAFEDVLCRYTLHLQLGRNRCRKLDKLVIEQRLTRFDRMRHTHSIDLGKNVVRQIRFDVEILKR